MLLCLPLINTHCGQFCSYMHYELFARASAARIPG
jgi:hypothetical protein